MFAQQPKGPPSNRTQTTLTSQSEAAAKEKLAGFVYEYLVHNGATKTAESFKGEMLSQNNASKQINIGDAPGFLQNWFFLFWDLYSAAPERRDTCEASQEAKAFHEYGFMNASHGVPPGPAGTPMMNGMHGSHLFPSAAASPLGMGPGPGPDGLMPAGYYPPRSGQPGPSGATSQSSPISGVPPSGSFAPVPPRYAMPSRNGPPGPGAMPPGAGFPGAGPPHIFGEQMRPMQPQRLPPSAGPMRMPTNFPGMRPNGPMRYGSQMYMESPTGTPFPPNAMMPNGAMCSSTPSMMSSPGPQGPMPTGPDGQADPRGYMMMSSASNIPYVMHGSEGSMTPGAGGRGSAGPPGSGPEPQVGSLLNGDEMKQSPASTHGGLNGGTPSTAGGPGSQAPVGGPGSVAGAGVGGPGSVHSQSGAPPNAVAGGSQGNGPGNSSNTNSGSGGQVNEEASEISKIKQSLFDDLKHFGAKEDNNAESYFS
uniref:LisH domain-containing protein n=2 Tax=Wuchereria bancrofti TaxID=6293 RepID=A0AAF5Q305_WUCBA